MKLTRLILYISYAGKEAKDIRSLIRRRRIFVLGVAAAVLTFICLVTRFCILTYGIEKKSFEREHISDFISFVIQAITVMVVAVPEGLSLAVTLALAFAVRVRLENIRLRSST